MNTYQEFYNNFISRSHYSFCDFEKTKFSSDLSSLWENLLYTNYGFPRFLTQLNNEFNFNNIIYKMVLKYAPKSMKIHERLTAKRYGYTFHSLTKEEMDEVTLEAYEMYRKVHHFFANLSDEQKNYIEILNAQRDNQIKSHVESHIYIDSSDVFKNSNNEYLEKYGCHPPTFNFDLILI